MPLFIHFILHIFVFTIANQAGSLLKPPEEACPLVIGNFLPPCLTL